MAKPEEDYHTSEGLAAASFIPLLPHFAVAVCLFLSSSAHVPLLTVAPFLGIGAFAGLAYVCYLNLQVRFTFIFFYFCSLHSISLRLSLLSCLWTIFLRELWSALFLSAILSSSLSAYTLSLRHFLLNQSIVAELTAPTPSPWTPSLLSVSRGTLSSPLPSLSLSPLLSSSWIFIWGLRLLLMASTSSSVHIEEIPASLLPPSHLYRHRNHHLWSIRMRGAREEKR